jgi:predicted acetyltransferase
MEVQAKPAEGAEQQRLAVGLMAAVHGGGAPSKAHWLRDFGHRYPGFHPEHTRIVWNGREVLAALRITSDTVQIGEARLRMGGLGWVSTAEHHRGKGYCRLLLQDAAEYMQRHGYHVSMLFGIPDLYQKFSYSTCLVDYTVSVNTVDALGFEPPHRLREARPAEIPVLQKLHSQNNSDIACSMLRTSGHFKNRWDLWQTWYAMSDHQGRTLGYFIAQPNGNRLEIDDPAVQDRGLCAYAMASAAQIANEASCDRIVIHAPPPHPLARYLIQFRSTHEANMDRDAGGMMALLNIQEALENMIPEWENLLANSLARDFRTEATLYVEGRPYRIRSNRGAVDVSMQGGASKVSLTQRDLIQLLTGYRHVEDVLAERRAIVLPEAHELLRTIFPKRSPYFWRFDRF